MTKTREISSLRRAIANFDDDAVRAKRAACREALSVAEQFSAALLQEIAAQKIAIRGNITSTLPAAQQGMRPRFAIWCVKLRRTCH